MRSSAAKRLTISFNKVNVSFKVYVLSGYLHIAVLSHLQTEDILLKKIPAGKQTKIQNLREQINI